MSYDFWEQPESPPSLFARRLRQIRSSAGLNATELAERAGVDPAVYRACELGARTISAALLMRIATALRLAPDVFFDPE